MLGVEKGGKMKSQGAVGTVDRKGKVAWIETVPED